MPRCPPAYKKVNMTAVAAAYKKVNKAAAETKPTKKPSAGTAAKTKPPKKPSAVTAKPKKKPAAAAGSSYIAPAAVHDGPVVVQSLLVWPHLASAETALTHPFYVIKFTAEKTAVVVTPVREGPKHVVRHLQRCSSDGSDSD